MLITIDITVPEDYPSGRINMVPDWVWQNVHDLRYKGYVADITMAIDGVPCRETALTDT